MANVLREYEFDPESPEAFPWLLECSSNRLAKTCVRTFDADNREGRRSIYAGGNSKQDIRYEAMRDRRNGRAS